jgi:hypothetical protein
MSPGDTPATRPLPARLLIALIRLYRGYSAHRSPACRFTPSCAEYALGAVERFGAWRGSGLALRRLGRCRPGGPFGYDPVPEIEDDGPPPGKEERR